MFIVSIARKKKSLLQILIKRQNRQMHVAYCAKLEVFDDRRIVMVFALYNPRQSGELENF